jgi:RNA polymerase sigma factor (sigma-70 family)
MNAPDRAADDAALLRALRTDADAFEAFYRRWAVPLHGWLRAQVGDADAGELTAETFAQVLVSAPSFRGSTPGEAVAWLWGIARNLARQHHRGARLEARARRRLGVAQRAYDTEPWDDVDARVSAGALARELTAAIDGLSEGQREALRLRIVADLDFGAVADRLGCEEPAARMRVSRALHLLRSRLQGVWS